MEDTFDKFTCVPDEVEKTYEKSPYVVCAFVGYYVWLEHIVKYIRNSVSIVETFTDRWR